MNYYKATRPDGMDFYTATIDYGAALLSGEVIRHPVARKVRNKADTYLSVSVSPTDCTGFSWPCRLFRVEPVGRVMGSGKVPLKASPNKRAVSALRVVEELPAWQVFGPQGQDVVAIIGRAGRLTADEADRLDTAQAAAWDSRTAAWSAARDAAWGCRTDCRMVRRFTSRITADFGRRGRRTCLSRARPHYHRAIRCAHRAVAERYMGERKMIEEMDFEVELVFRLRTRIGFAPIERSGPITHLDAIANAIGLMPDASSDDLFDGFGGEFTTTLEATVKKIE